ncbi:MAG: hypothetical protein HY726_23355 [Candidatus Rokubacteria bacterium]|nr:hypothetical protein [Candidatus Rokubacteria bacterium]
MIPKLADIVALTQSLSGEQEPEAVAATALGRALSVLQESAGLAFVRTHLGTVRVASRHGLGAESEPITRALCEPQGPVARALANGRCQLVPADNGWFTSAAHAPMPHAEVRFLAVVPFLALGESVGGLLLFLRQEPDKVVWDEVLPYIGATTGLALAQIRFKETVARQGRLASLGRVAAGVAHELRNPLTVLGATMDLLQLDLQLGIVARAKLDRAHNAFNRVVRLVDGLSGYSKPTKRMLEQVQLSELFSTVVDLLGSEARSRHIEISVSCTPRALAVKGDRTQLLEVLINLVENAIDAIDRNGAIHLNADLSSGEARISVLDSGPGIPADLVDQIFDPFFTTKPNGTGLGLVIVREILERLGGMIRVATDHSKGTEFVVTLPPA